MRVACPVRRCGAGRLTVGNGGTAPRSNPTQDRRLRGAAPGHLPGRQGCLDKALANEGLLAMDSAMPKSLSDRGTQMRSKSIRRFFVDLGITQLFARPHTPADNAEIESFFATIKGERLYKMSYDDPIQMINDVDGFVIFYNEERLHQGIGFVTPAEKHDGSWEAITEARRIGMKQAQQHRLEVNRGCRGNSDAD